MADDSDKILINVGLNANEATESLDALSQKIKEVAKQDLGDTSVKSYKQQIRELQNELQKVEQIQGRGSQAFKDGIVAVRKTQISSCPDLQFRKNWRLLIPALGKFGALVPIAKGAVCCFEPVLRVQWVYSGLKGEKAEEVMLRLQSILALSHALSGNQ